MFKHLISVYSTTNTQADKLAIEGLFDTLWGSIKKKDSPDSVDKSISALDKDIMKTYGDPAWVAKTGVVDTSTISGKNIFEYLAVNGKIPHPLEAAIDRHIATVDHLGKKWKTEIEAHAESIYKACEATKKLKTNAERIERLHTVLKDIHQPVLLKNVSLSGLMGIVKVGDYDNLSIGGTNTEKAIEPIPKEDITKVAKLTCKVLKAVEVFDDYYIPITDNETFANRYGNPKENTRGEESDDFWDHFFSMVESNPHTKQLLLADERIYLDTYYELIRSNFQLAKALERWMYRSMK